MSTDDLHDLMGGGDAPQSDAKQLMMETNMNAILFTQTQRRKRKRFEDNRKRCTFWLNEEAIKTIYEICDIEDKPKYQVIEEAIMMYGKKIKRSQST